MRPHRKSRFAIEFLHKLQIEKGLDQKELSKLLGVTQQAVSLALKGKTGLSGPTVKRLIEAYPEAEKYILQNPQDKEAEAVVVDKSGSPQMEIPLIGAYASLPETWGDEEMRTYPLYTTMRRDDGVYVAFEIRGDSMTCEGSNSLFEGDIIVCRELQRQHWINRLHIPKVFVLIHRTRGIFCKQIIGHDVTNGIITLHSFNPEYEDFTLSLDELDKLFYVKSREGAYRD